MNKAFKFNEKILQNLLEEGNIFLKKINIKVSLQKNTVRISPINTRKLETLQKSIV